MSELNGKETASRYRVRIEKEVNNLRKNKIIPTIAPILVGNDPGAKVYFRQKKKLANELGIRFAGVKLGPSTTMEELSRKIRELNQDERISGLFVELPLPDNLDFREISKLINVEKDIDCINPMNSGVLFSGGATDRSYEQLKNDPSFLLPATPYGVLELLIANGIEVQGKETVVVGGGAIGLPVAMLLLRKSYSTVTICEYREDNLKEKTKRADILISAIGKRDFISDEMVKNGAVVLDVGINQTKNGITGDVDYEAVKRVASYITPVPGGVGPMTTTMIMSNTVKAAKNLNDYY